MQNDYVDWMKHRIQFDDSYYDYLLGCLDDIRFYCHIDSDYNRAEDTKMLRYEYEQDTGEVIDGEPSVLEVLVSFAIRIDNEYIGDASNPRPYDIFWEMLCNLKLNKHENCNNSGRIEMIANIWMNRQFRPDGLGSIFPMKHTTRDQTRLDMWSQMNEYIDENY